MRRQERGRGRGPPHASPRPQSRSTRSTGGRRFRRRWAARRAAAAAPVGEERARGRSRSERWHEEEVEDEEASERWHEEEAEEEGGGCRAVEKDAQQHQHTVGERGCGTRRPVVDHPAITSIVSRRRSRQPFSRRARQSAFGTTARTSWRSTTRSTKAHVP